MYLEELIMEKLTYDEFLRRIEERNITNLDLLSEYINYRTTITCRCKECGHVFDRFPSVLLQTNKCPKCSKRKVRVSKEEFIMRLNSTNKGYKLIGKYVNMITHTDFQCEKGHIWSSTPANITASGHNCPYCTHKKPWIGETDLWTTNPEVAKLLKNSDYGYRYMRSTPKKAEFVCPDCGHVDKKTVGHVCSYGYVCNNCGDNISYPNKFGRAFLSQLPIENHICEYQPKWRGRHSYDNYFEYNSKQYILEMDGGMHYDEGVLLGKSLEERQQVDKDKDDDAMANNVHIIRINCEQSDCDFISNNILQSELSLLFDLSNINWKLCDEKANRNIVRDVCLAYMSGEHNLDTIARSMKICTSTVREYLKRGANIGWCDYDSIAEIEKAHIRSRRRVVLLDDKGNVTQEFHGVYNNLQEIRQVCGVDVTCGGVMLSCIRHKPHKGVNFRYAEEYNTK